MFGVKTVEHKANQTSSVCINTLNEKKIIDK